MFRFEAEMTPLVEDWLVKRGLDVKREFQTPWGFSDLVGCSLNQIRLRKRLALGQKKPIGPLLRVDVFKRVPDVNTGRSVTARGLEGQYGGCISRERLEKELAWLVANGFAVQPRSDRYQSRNGWCPLHKELVAVELKLGEVSQVVRQAASNLQFASESYVALPQAVALKLANSRRLDGLKMRGIGLLALKNDRCMCLIRSKPIPSEGASSVQMHSVERFFRTRLTGRST